MKLPRLDPAGTDRDDAQLAAPLPTARVRVPRHNARRIGDPVAPSAAELSNAGAPAPPDIAHRTEF